jgi:hypothetical protein
MTVPACHQARSVMPFITTSVRSARFKVGRKGAGLPVRFGEMTGNACSGNTATGPSGPSEAFPNHSGLEEELEHWAKRKLAIQPVT